MGKTAGCTSHKHSLMDFLNWHFGRKPLIPQIKNLAKYNVFWLYGIFSHIVCTCILYRSQCAYFFSLSWLITWFGHVARRADEVYRLFDFFLASHPLMPIYLSGAVSSLTILTVMLQPYHVCMLQL